MEFGDLNILDIPIDKAEGNPGYINFFILTIKIRTFCPGMQILNCSKDDKFLICKMLTVGYFQSLMKISYH